MNTTLEIQESVSAQPVITVDDLSLQYGGKTAFQDINLSIYEGLITTLIGPSGCGKTSFLLCLNRLIDLVSKSRVSGMIRFDSVNVLHPRTDVRTLRRDIGMIFQKPNPFPISIRKNLELPLKEQGIKNRKEIDEIITSTLGEVGLWDEVKDRLSYSALALSGGQQQRLCIARALVLKPKVLLMDEPCSALDPISSGVVEDLIKNLRGRCTVVVVTHNLAQAKRIADFSALFWVQNGGGCLIDHGSANQIFDTPQNAITAAYVNGERG